MTKLVPWVLDPKPNLFHNFKRSVQSLHPRRHVNNPPKVNMRPEVDKKNIADQGDAVRQRYGM